MSEGSNHNLASEFKKHPDRAKWLVDKVLPAMEKHFEDFDVNFVISTLTDDTMDDKKIKQLYHSYQKKQNSFQAKDIKRARPAYQFFCNENRKKLQEKNADVNFGEVNKLLGKMWSELSEKDRRPYEKQAEKDKSRYQKEFDAAKEEAITRGDYVPNLVKEIKKARTSYLCFSTDPAIRKKYQKKAGDIKELMKILGKEWKKMSDKEKQPYEELAKEDKERFEKEKAAALKKQKKLQESVHSNHHDEDKDDAEGVESEGGEGVESDGVESDGGDEVHVPKKSKGNSKSKPAKKAAKKSPKKPASKKAKKSSVSSNEDDVAEADE